MAVGFVKFLGGALCCIVPIPAVQAVGGAIAAAGVIDMIEAAKDESDQKERAQQAIPHNRVPADYEREQLDKTKPH